MVTIGSLTYDGTRTAVSLDRLFLAEGDLDSYEFSVNLSQDDFRYGSIPLVKTKVTIDSVVYRIMDVRKDAANISVILDLGGEYQNVR